LAIEDGIVALLSNVAWVLETPERRQKQQATQAAAG
jgi:hypothetical protein